jgi:hypothetical protein
LEKRGVISGLSISRICMVLPFRACSEFTELGQGCGRICWA